MLFPEGIFASMYGRGKLFEQSWTIKHPKQELTFCGYVQSKIRSQVLGVVVKLNHYTRSASQMVSYRFSPKYCKDNDNISYAVMTLIWALFQKLIFHFKL